MTEVIRPQLGNYMSVDCFRYLRIGAEDTAGRALIVMAGKSRGHSLQDLLVGISPDDEAAIKASLDHLLGIEGTRLCLVQDVKKTAVGYTISIDESACASGVVADEPICAYTMGVFIGVMEVISGKRMTGHETECIAAKGNHCVYELEALN